MIAKVEALLRPPILLGRRPIHVCSTFVASVELWHTIALAVMLTSI